MSQTDPTSNCARVLLATTNGWKPGDGNASTLANARMMLAEQVYVLDGKGFPPPVSDDVANKPGMQDIWSSCMAAAQAARDDHGNPRDPLGRHVVFWVADPANPGKLDDQAGLGLNWPFQPDSHVTRVSGPILDGVDPRPKRLFFFDSIAEKAAIASSVDPSPGFWPQSDEKHSAPPAAPAPASSGIIARPVPSLRWATGLFVLWMLSGIVLTFWLGLAGDMIRNAAVGFQSAPIAQKCVGDGAGSPKGQAAWVADCDAEWSQDWIKQRPASSDGVSNWIRSWLWLPSDKSGHLSLLIPFLSTMVSMLVLMMAAGLATKGRWFGVLIDDRNRMSLSRAQQVAWTILLMAGLTMMGWFNAAAISAVAQSDPNGWNLFPTMPGALWTAMGINLVATPYLSDLILSSKDPQRQADKSGQQSSIALLVNQIVRPARLDTNTSSAEASWVDLITGETAGTDQQLDVSRVQHLIISGALLTTYFMALTSSLSDIAGESIMTSITSSKTVFSNMPGVGTTTFLGLLGISHGSYLAFKANAAEGSSAASDTQAPKSAGQS
jgi:hypothetical protein